MEIDGIMVQSTECVIFLNSVKGIINLIKKCELMPDDVNIIMGNSEDNDKEISKIGEGFSRGRIPLKGERHKKFTFCTSTAFAGCDFYSTTASTFVISDPKQTNTTIDIATDLVQIAGRQRLAENPFRQFITFVYKIGIFDKPEDEFFSELEQKRVLTIAEIEDNNATSNPELLKKKIKDCVRLQRMCNYSESFTMYDTQSGIFKFNEFAYLSQKYVYDLQRYNYINGIAVKDALMNNGFDLHGNQIYNATDDYEQQLGQIITTESFADRMKRYCEWRDNGNIYAIALNNIENKYPQLRLFYEELGSERIRALGYKEKSLQNEVNTNHIQGRLTEEMQRRFPIGDRLYSLADIKAIMLEVFSIFNVDKKGKITDLENLYHVKMQLTKPTISIGKRENRYKVVAHPHLISN